MASGGKMPNGYMTRTSRWHQRYHRTGSSDFPPFVSTICKQVSACAQPVAMAQQLIVTVSFVALAQVKNINTVFAFACWTWHSITSTFVYLNMCININSKTTLNYANWQHIYQNDDGANAKREHCRCLYDWQITIYQAILCGLPGVYMAILGGVTPRFSSRNMLTISEISK